jgi:hypothetical protein
MLVFARLALLSQIVALGNGDKEMKNRAAKPCSSDSGRSLRGLPVRADAPASAV